MVDEEICFFVCLVGDYDVYEIEKLVEEGEVEIWFGLCCWDVVIF